MLHTHSVRKAVVPVDSRPRHQTPNGSGDVYLEAGDFLIRSRPKREDSGQFKRPRDRPIATAFHTSAQARSLVRCDTPCTHAEGPCNICKEYMKISTCQHASQHCSECTCSLLLCSAKKVARKLRRSGWLLFIKLPEGWRRRRPRRARDPLTTVCLFRCLRGAYTDHGARIELVDRGAGGRAPARPTSAVEQAQAQPSRGNAAGSIQQARTKACGLQEGIGGSGASPLNSGVVGSDQARDFPRY